MGSGSHCNPEQARSSKFKEALHHYFDPDFYVDERFCYPDTRNNYSFIATIYQMLLKPLPSQRFRVVCSTEFRSTRPTRARFGELQPTCSWTSYDFPPLCFATTNNSTSSYLSQLLPRKWFCSTISLPCDYKRCEARPAGFC